MASFRKVPHISIGPSQQVGEGTDQAGIRDNSQYYQGIQVLSGETEVGCIVLWADLAQQGLRSQGQWSCGLSPHWLWGPQLCGWEGGWMVGEWMGQWVG